MLEQPSILLIEDEARLRQNLRVLLEGEGYRVVSAEDGAEGIRKLQEEPFELVITDVVMPQVDGFQVMEYLKDHCPDVVVVAITAYVSTESAIEALRRGAYDYLAKPFDVDLMQIVIKRALEKARMQKAFRHYMGELERRVEERTHKLAEAKMHLEKSMEELGAAQEQLIQMERFRALGEVTAIAAHELGDSMATIVGFAEVLAKTAPPDSRLKTQLEQIGEMAFRCHEIVKDLAHFPWKPPLQKAQTNLNDVCEQMLASLAYQADLSTTDIERRFDLNLPFTMVDPQRLSQAFSTVALHAWKTALSYRKGVRLTVETARGQTAIRIVFRAEGRDPTGGQRAGFFEPFLATQEGAGGLGLSLAYGVIKEHDGRMSVYSAPGEGVTYLVELPIRAPLPSPTEPVLDAIDVGERKRVLVVDADEKNLALLQEIVRHLGHDPEGGASAQQALQKIADNDYDLLITDMHLPTIDGLHLYQRLTTLRPGLAQRVIFISGGVISDEVCVFLERVGCHLIRKPFSVADIEAGMRQALGG
jgi:CheY-like chemotaxis protein/nitrogen-specific signal transduction histidine kinase